MNHQYLASARLRTSLLNVYHAVNKRKNKPVSKVKPSQPKPNSAASSEERSAKNLAQISLVISIFSAIFAGWSAYETRETRLDSTRVRLTALTQQTLSEARVALSYYKCFQTILGTSSSLSDHSKVERLVNELEPKVRKSMSKFKDWGEKELAIWENELTGSGSISDAVKTTMLEARKNWSKEDAERLDAICKV